MWFNSTIWRNKVINMTSGDAYIYGIGIKPENIDKIKELITEYDIMQSIINEELKSSVISMTARLCFDIQSYYDDMIFDLVRDNKWMIYITSDGCYDQYMECRKYDIIKVRELFEKLFPKNEYIIYWNTGEFLNYLDEWIYIMGSHRDSHEEWMESFAVKEKRHIERKQEDIMEKLTSFEPVTDACSHLIISVKLRTGGYGYECVCEEETCAGCIKDGWCPIDTDRKIYLNEVKEYEKTVCVSCSNKECPHTLVEIDGCIEDDKHRKANEAFDKADLEEAERLQRQEDADESDEHMAYCERMRDLGDPAYQGY